VCYSICSRLWRVRSVYGVVGSVGGAGDAEMIRCALLCMLEAVESWLCLLETPEVMRGVLLCSLEVLTCWR